MKQLLTGNEAIARGAFEAGVKVAAGYPGTPSTEVLENFVKYPGVDAQWSPNEKVALEVGVGSSIAGARTLVTMKHVGVNVAADPLFTFSYTGVNGGLVLLSADDPGMHSSQNEQDNRYYGKFAKVPVIEPADSQECKDFIGVALEISETFDTPVILRTTTRVAHSQSLVEIEQPISPQLKPYQKNPKKYVMIPAHARLRHHVVEQRLVKLAEYAETTPLNRIEWGDTSVGIITSGITYQYVKEALPQASCLKLGFSFPLPANLIKEFAAKVEKLYVVEELEPFLEEAIKAMGIEVHGKDLFPLTGELTPRMIAEKITGLGNQDHVAASAEGAIDLTDIPLRPPVMCPGCPHRAVFYTLRQLKLTVSGDIGCYTLGALPPLDSMDTTICMGASIGVSLGMEKANPELKGKVVSVIGDSTFFHSGLTGLLDMVYNGGQGTLLILDNSTTAMTGHQEHPATGKTLGQQPAPVVDLVKLVESLGIRRVKVVDPFDLNNLKTTIAEEVAASEVSVIIAKRPCALLVKNNPPAVAIDAAACTHCKVCLKLGCPALADREGQMTVNGPLCTGCGVCLQVCKFDAIKKAGDGNE